MLPNCLPTMALPSALADGAAGSPVDLLPTLGECAARPAPPLPTTDLPAPSDGALKVACCEQIPGAGRGFARVRGAPGWRSWRRSRTRTSA